MKKDTEHNHGLLDERDSRQPGILKSILKAGRNLLGVLALGVACGAAIYIGMTRSFNTSEYISEGYHSIRRPVGLLDTVKMTKSGTGDNTTRTFEYEKQTGISNYMNYSDKAEDPNSLDGRTDELTISSHHRTINVKRENGREVRHE